MLGWHLHLISSKSNRFNNVLRNSLSARVLTKKKQISAFNIILFSYNCWLHRQIGSAQGTTKHHYSVMKNTFHPWWSKIYVQSRMSFNIIKTRWSWIYSIIRSFDHLLMTERFMTNDNLASWRVHYRLISCIEHPPLAKTGKISWKFQENYENELVTWYIILSVQYRSARK